MRARVAEREPSIPGARPAGRGELYGRLYALIANEEDARSCSDIDEAACREVPGNFFRLLVSLLLTKLGDLLTSPKTVLAWLMGAVGAPVAMVAWLVPLRESGSLIPQLGIAAFIRRHAVRKGFWVLGSVIQGAAVAAMGLAALWLRGWQAGAAILALLAVFSLARGLSSVAIKDVLGKTIPKRRRGRLTGLASSLSGAAVILVSGLALADLDENASVWIYTALLAGAGLLWWLAAAIFVTVRESPGETGGGANALRDAWRSLALLREDVPFRNFVISRALMLCSALSAPFYVLLAQSVDAGLATLGLFVFANGLASLVSAGFWGVFADHSSRMVMVAGASVAALLGLLVAPVAWSSLGESLGVWLYPLAFFLLNVAHSGVRIGRKTYLVDMAEGNRRTDYVAVSNSVIGVLLLLTGAVSALAALAGAAAAIALLACMGLAGAITAWRLPEVTGNPS